MYYEHCTVESFKFIEVYFQKLSKICRNIIIMDTGIS